jgi:hypothetical protein
VFRESLRPIEARTAPLVKETGQTNLETLVFHGCSLPRCLSTSEHLHNTTTTITTTRTTLHPPSNTHIEYPSHPRFSVGAANGERPASSIGAANTVRGPPPNRTPLLRRWYEVYHAEPETPTPKPPCRTSLVTVSPSHFQVSSRRHVEPLRGATPHKGPRPRAQQPEEQGQGPRREEGEA